MGGRRSRTTPWFNQSLDPHHIGVYQRLDYDGSVRWSFWDGAKWRGLCDTHAEASASPEYVTSHDWLQWRGLAARPRTQSPAR